MAETDYRKMWQDLWAAIRNKHGIPAAGAIDRDNYHAAIRETLLEYLLDIYREAVRKQYTGVPMRDADPLVLRMVAIHHWKIEEAAALDSQQIAIALADEINHFHLPDEAARWAFGQAKETMDYRDLDFVLAHMDEKLIQEVDHLLY